MEQGTKEENKLLGNFISSILYCMLYCIAKINPLQTRFVYGILVKKTKKNS
jgi:hypothetical protein